MRSFFHRSRLAFLVLALACLAIVTLSRGAYAAGNVKLTNAELNEVGQGWHLFVTVELPKAPLTAHQTMKFHFTKTVAFERSLVDGHDGPVTNRTPLSNQSPQIESLDVDFANAQGKIWKGTRFDFKVTRTRGFEAGEYKLEVRTSDGNVIGAPMRLVLKGDNEVVDRRSIAFNAKDPSVKKVEAYDAGANQAKNDDVAPTTNTMGDVEATGAAQPFVPKDAYEPLPEEDMKTRPKGCGCSVPGFEGGSLPTFALFLTPLAGLGLAMRARRRRDAA